HAFTLVFAHNHSLYRCPTRRHFIDHRDIEVAVDRHSQRSGNRSCCHHDNVRIKTKGTQAGTLQYAETMLLVKDGQTELIKTDRFLYDRLRTNHTIYFTGRDLSVKLALLGGLQAAGEQFDTVTRAFKESFGVACVLFGEDLGRCHHRRLISVFHRSVHRREGHDRLAAANVALDE